MFPLRRLDNLAFDCSKILEYLEAAWPHGELGIMVGQENSFFAIVAGFVMRMDCYPHDNVIAFGGIQWPDRIHLFQFDVRAPRCAHSFTLLNAVATIHGDPNIAGGILVSSGFLGHLESIAAKLADRIFTDRVADAPLARRLRVCQQFATGDVWV